MGGMLLVYAVGPQVSYWSLIWISFVAPVIFVLTSMCVPESPYFHLQRNLEYKAFNNLTWLRKGATKEQVIEEVKAIKVNQNTLYRTLRVFKFIKLLTDLKTISNPFLNTFLCVIDRHLFLRTAHSSINMMSQ